MFLEIVTFLMFALVLVLKYGVVSRMVRLNRRLREAEGKVRRHEAHLKRQQNGRRVSEREENTLVRRQIALESEMRRIEEELGVLKQTNEEVVAQLGKSRVTDLLS